jgi:hypothetical protein
MTSLLPSSWRCEWRVTVRVTLLLTVSQSVLASSPFWDSWPHICFVRDFWFCLSRSVLPDWLTGLLCNGSVFVCVGCVICFFFVFISNFILCMYVHTYIHVRPVSQSVSQLVSQSVSPGIVQQNMPYYYYYYCYYYYYDDSLNISTIICLTATNFESFTFSVLGFAFSHV